MEAPAPPALAPRGGRELDSSRGRRTIEAGAPGVNRVSSPRAISRAMAATSQSSSAVACENRQRWRHDPLHRRERRLPVLVANEEPAPRTSRSWAPDGSGASGRGPERARCSPRGECELFRRMTRAMDSVSAVAEILIGVPSGRPESPASPAGENLEPSSRPLATRNRPHQDLDVPAGTPALDPRSCAVSHLARDGGDPEELVHGGEAEQGSPSAGAPGLSPGPAGEAQTGWAR
jgi:hypothetical protein